MSDHHHLQKGGASHHNINKKHRWCRVLILLFACIVAFLVVSSYLNTHATFHVETSVKKIDDSNPVKMSSGRPPYTEPVLILRSSEEPSPSSPTRVHDVCDAIASSTLEAPLRIACVGDSITYGNGSHVRRKERDGEGSYPLELVGLLTSAASQRLQGSGETALRKHFKVRNFGKSGRTIMTAKEKFSYRHQPEYKQSLAFLPNVVLFMLGTNDSKSRHWEGRASFMEKLASLIRAYSELSTKPRIYIALPPPALPLLTQKSAHKAEPSYLGNIDANRIAHDIHDVVKEFIASHEAKSMNVVDEAVDVFGRFNALDEVKEVEDAVSSGDVDRKGKAFRAAKRWLHDGVHPSVMGHRLIAEAFAETICHRR